MPSTSFLSKMKLRFGNKLVAAVDACQLRCDDSAIRDYVNEGIELGKLTNNLMSFCL